MLGYRAILLACAAMLAVLWAGGWFAVTAPPIEGAPTYTPPATESPITPIPASLELDRRKVDLGRRLFHDRRLSGDGTVACASCHDLKLAGVDARRVAVGVGNQSGTVNSPTVLNSGFNFSQFWDGRAATLEDQVEGPIHNPIEMDSTWAEVTAKLSGDSEYVAAFKAIWPDGIKPAHIQSAIAEFERSLITPGSAFDRYLEGEAQALSAEARKGWDLFRNLGCIACHQGVNMGGNMFANLGVMGDFFAERGRPLAQSDLGRFNVTGRAEDRHVFKVPSLRNVALTGPYFHDGSIPDLAQAVETMARYQLGVVLTQPETHALVAFLKSLDGVQPESAP